MYSFEILLYLTGVFYRIYIFYRPLWVVCYNQLQIVLRGSGLGGGGDHKVPYNHHGRSETEGDNDDVVTPVTFTCANCFALGSSPQEIFAAILFCPS